MLTFWRLMHMRTYVSIVLYTDIYNCCVGEQSYSGFVKSSFWDRWFLRRAPKTKTNRNQTKAKTMTKRQTRLTGEVARRTTSVATPRLGL